MPKCPLCKGAGRKVKKGGRAPPWGSCSPKQVSQPRPCRQLGGSPVWWGCPVHCPMVSSVLWPPPTRCQQLLPSVMTTKSIFSCCLVSPVLNLPRRRPALSLVGAAGARPLCWRSHGEHVGPRAKAGEGDGTWAKAARALGTADPEPVRQLPVIRLRALSESCGAEPGSLSSPCYIVGGPSLLGLVSSAVKWG